MHRLPTPGSDNGTWGDILNDFLSQSHVADGSLANNVVGADQIRNNVIADAHVSNAAAISRTKLSPGVQTSLAAADAAITRPGAGLNGKIVKWNSSSGQLEDATGLLNATINDGAAWKTGTAYSGGTVVTYSGGRYLTPDGAPTSSVFDSSNWVLLGAAPDSF